MKSEGVQNVNQMINKELNELETGPEEDETTIDLALSTDVEKSGTDFEEDEVDPDSALGSQMASAPIIPEMSFKPLSMSETKSSSQWSQISEKSPMKTLLSENSPMKTLMSENSPMKTQREIIVAETQNDKQDSLHNEKPSGKEFQKEAMENLGAKVNQWNQYLERLRKDDKFQFSFSSELSRKSPEKETEIKDEETKMTFGTDLDTSTINEDKFRKGLQESLDLSDDVDD